MTKKRALNLNPEKYSSDAEMKCPFESARYVAAMVRAARAGSKSSTVGKI